MGRPSTDSRRVPGRRVTPAAPPDRTRRTLPWLTRLGIALELENESCPGGSHGGTVESDHHDDGVSDPESRDSH